MKKNLNNRTIRVTMAQINTTVGDLQGNRNKILDSLAEAAKRESRLVTFPEMAVTGYPPEDLLFREKFIADNKKMLLSVVPYVRGMIAVIGFVDSDPRGGLYNAAAYVQNGRILHLYRKALLPNYGVFDEKRYFQAGEGNVLIYAGGLRLGATICEDIWQKESRVYEASYAGTASVIVNISASPYQAGKHKEREALLRNLARKTRAAVVYQNLIGGQDELVFDGSSLALDASGRIVASAISFGEQLLTFDLPVAKPQMVSRGFHVVRGQSLAESLTPIQSFEPRGVTVHEDEVYRALVLGTADYVRKNGFKKVLLGLSGGIDSALVAKIAVDAIGCSNVIGVTMPSPFTSKETYTDALNLARGLDIECREIRIDNLFQDYLKLLKPAFGALGPDATEENLQARIRGNILMALSNKFGYLVLTTGNKSEMATGYCTLYGDMAGGFAVLKDVPKTLVFKIARHLNRVAEKPVIPPSIIRRPPTAELRRNQKDQDTLPPYPLLDRFLEAYIEQDRSVDDAVRRGIPRRIAQKIARMVDVNEYKRRQSPPGIKITPKAFGRDRRMPITNRYS